jgi:glycosyltransferase involved in cell wall biosynthesis
MRRLGDNGYPHGLIVAGPKPGAEDAKVAAEAGAPLPGHPGRVLWLGLVPDPELAKLMAHAAAFCHPAFTESFGLSVLEAMACGAPVVVSNRGSLPEVVEDAGILCEPTADSVAGSLERVLSDQALAGELRKAARRRAEELPWSRTAKGWLGVLKSAA